ncbi:MAG: thioredoxin-like domain-containing protein, partial [Mangrovibacterium sp.]
KENPVYYTFMQEDSRYRQQLALLEQLLVGYDSPNSSLYKQAISEFEKRRKKYNQWITTYQEENKDLYVSHFFPFQKVPASNWDILPEQRANEQAQHYFDEIDLNDVLILKTQTFDNYMNNYMRMFGERATSVELRDSLFTQAGRIACEKASHGDPMLYGWMVDYFYQGYESYDITMGIKMLEQHIKNPNCLTSKKQEILRRLEGMAVLVEGSLAPEFDAQMPNGMQVHFKGVSEDKDFGLLIFYDSTCGHCTELLKELKTWYEKPDNRVWYDIITISVDNERTQWREFHAKENPLWTDIWAPGGINSQVCKDYYILSSPVVFIIDKNQEILATPVNVKEVIEFLNKAE